jgi:hypothetical protein
MMKHALSALLALGSAAHPLSAQAAPGPFEASLSIPVGMTDAKKISSGTNPTGYILGFGVRTELHPSLSTRVHFGFMSFAGKEGSGLENRNRLHPHFGLDVMKDYGSLHVFGGLTGTQWRQAVTASNPDFTLANRAEGVKMGYRVGAEYDLAKGFSCTAAFTQSEFNRKFNPSWASLGVVYRFKGN